MSDWQEGSLWEHRRLGDGTVDCHGVVWEAVLADLTTMLETGEPLLVVPWEVSTG